MELLNAFIEKKINLKAVLHSLSEGLVIMDKDEKIIFTNQACQDILKVNVEQFPAREWPQALGVFHLNGTQLFKFEEMPIFQSLRGITLKDYRLVVRNSGDREDIYISANSVPLRDEGDNILGSMVTFQDISLKVKRERKIVDERMFFQRLLDFIPANILIKDLEHKIIYVNKNFRDIFGVTNLDGQTAYDFIPQHGPAVTKEDNQVIQTKRELSGTLDIKHPDGLVKQYAYVRFPIFDNNGSVNGVCVIAFDETQKIEQQKILETERIKSINASKLAALGTLAAEIGHEINNPLGIIKTSVVILNSMLDEKEDPEVIKEQVSVINQTTDRITNIVSALKHVSRESTKEKFSLCSLSCVLNDVQALCLTKFKIKNIQLIIDDSEADMSERVFCLRVQLSQVLLNVLVNASDAVEGQKDPWVKIKIVDEGNYFCFKVTDCGPGVPEEVQSRLFEPFFTTKDIGAGTGLGLSISKDIMLRQSGDIYLDTSVGNNCFVIKVPKKTSEHSA